MTVLNYLSLCSEWVLDAVSWWRRSCKLKLCLSWRSLAVEHPEGQLLTKSPHSPSTQGASFLLCRLLSRRNIWDKWSALGRITCLQYGTLVGQAPLTLKSVTAGPAKWASSKIGVTEAPVHWAHCLGAGNHICLQIWLTVLQHKCFTPGSNLLYILDSPTPCSFPCITYPLVLALSWILSLMVRDWERVRPGKLPHVSTLIFYNR